jgi:c-di-GMP-related signal transduction protein
MDVFVARQAIFDRAMEVQAYELLFRSDKARNEFDGTESASATTQVIANSLLSIGLDKILGGKKAFVNFDRTLLLGGLHEILPPETLAIEILETVEPDGEVLGACQRLKGLGYTIALDDFVNCPQLEPLVDVASVIKVDLMATPRREQEHILHKYGSRGIAMLAEKVETREEFEWASRAGYVLFQGYFFAKPVIVTGHQIPAAKVTCIRLLSELQNEELDLARLKTLISEDVSLSYKLLRYVNSCLFALRSDIHSIAAALTALGEIEIRRWIALAALPALAKDKPGELVMQSLVRARFCELVAGLVGARECNQAFLTGLFSLLDALIGMPLDQALREASIDGSIRGALLGTAPENDAVSIVYKLVRQYEASEWDAVTATVHALRLKTSAITAAYADSTLWAQQVLRITGRKMNTRRDVRYSAKGAIQVLVQDDAGRERVVNATLLNISARGMQLQMDVRLPERTVVRCNYPRLHISGSGSVRYCVMSKGSYIVGLDFSSGTGWHEPSRQ